MGLRTGSPYSTAKSRVNQMISKFRRHEIAFRSKPKSNTVSDRERILFKLSDRVGAESRNMLTQLNLAATVISDSLEGKPGRLDRGWPSTILIPILQEISEIGKASLISLVEPMLEVANGRIVIEALLATGKIATLDYLPTLREKSSQVLEHFDGVENAVSNAFAAICQRHLKTADECFGQLKELGKQGQSKVINIEGKAIERVAIPLALEEKNRELIKQLDKRALYNYIVGRNDIDLLSLVLETTRVPGYIAYRPAAYKIFFEGGVDNPQAVDRHCQVLGELGGNAVEVLFWLLGHNFSAYRQSALKALKAINPSSLEGKYVVFDDLIKRPSSVEKEQAFLHCIPAILRDREQRGLNMLREIQIYEYRLSRIIFNDASFIKELKSIPAVTEFLPFVESLDLKESSRCSKDYILVSILIDLGRKEYRSGYLTALAYSNNRDKVIKAMILEMNNSTQKGETGKADDLRSALLEKATPEEKERYNLS